MVRRQHDKPTTLLSLADLAPVADDQSTSEARREDGAWREVVRGQSVGHKRVDRFEPVRTDGIRFTCTQSLAEPVVIRSFAAYDLSWEAGSSKQDG